VPFLKRPAEQFYESLGGQPAVCLLRPESLGTDPQCAAPADASGQPFEYTPLLTLRKALAVRHVQQHGDPAVDLIDVLAAGAAASRRPKNKFVPANLYAARYLNRLGRTEGALATGRRAVL